MLSIRNFAIKTVKAAVVLPRPAVYSRVICATDAAGTGAARLASGHHSLFASENALRDYESNRDKIHVRPTDKFPGMDSVPGKTPAALPLHASGDFSVSFIEDVSTLLRNFCCSASAPGDIFLLALDQSVYYSERHEQAQ